MIQAMQFPRLSHLLNRHTLSAMAALLLWLVFVPSVYAGGGGDLDPTLNGTGVLTVSVSADGYHAGRAVTVQPDGKILLVGNTGLYPQRTCAVLRFQPDGRPDVVFGRAGIVTPSFGAGNEDCYGLALLPDGQIIIAGGAEFNGVGHMVLAQYTPTGAPDTTFNAGGIVTTTVNGQAGSATALALQPDGKIITVGVTNFPALNQMDVALLRFHPNGGPDSSFNQTGAITTAVGPLDDFAIALAVQPDNSIVVAGFSRLADEDTDPFLLRFTPDGIPDAAFNGSGLVITPVSPYHDRTLAVALQSDGKIVTTGHAYVGHMRQSKLMVIRYHSDGTLDNSFGANGIVLWEISGSHIGGEAVAIQPDGKIVVAGSWGNVQYGSQPALARFLPDGQPDPTFKSSGIVTTVLNNWEANIYAMAIQPDSRILLAGDSYSRASDPPGLYSDLLLLRYLDQGMVYLPAVVKEAP
jgi:uncharacterized delta-60 repeat protein